MSTEKPILPVGDFYGDLPFVEGANYSTSACFHLGPLTSEVHGPSLDEWAARREKILERRLEKRRENPAHAELVVVVKTRSAREVAWVDASLEAHLAPDITLGEAKDALLLLLRTVRRL